MNKIKIFVAAALLTVGTTASAQFTNSKSSSSRSDVSEGWNTVWVQYNPSKFSVAMKNADDVSFTGFSVGYSHAFNISKGTPVYVEAGVGLQYTFDSEDYGTSDYDDGDLTAKYSLLSVKVPVNLMYDWQIPNSSVSITPYIGLNLRYNIIGKFKIEYDDEDGESEEWDWNVFDKKEMSDLNDLLDSDLDTWKRFQIGWQIGVNARFNNTFLVGVSYGADFSEICEKTKIKTTSITLGYCF